MMLPLILRVRTVAAALAFSCLALHGAAAQYRLEPAYTDKLTGPASAKGAVVWSHGRSVNSEDSLSPTPNYIQVLRKAGWDVFRFNRMREGDTLTDSARELVLDVAKLKKQGYRKIVLSGQSFGAFLSLMAADQSEDVHAVIATSPAAFGTFNEFYGSWRANATRLYPILEQVRSARVMLFFFHGDDFDPGGRGDRAEQILSAHQIDHLIVDQPPLLTGHWASTTNAFVQQFGDCIRDFIDAKDVAKVACQDNYGDDPEQQVSFPAEVRRPAATVTASGGQ